MSSVDIKAVRRRAKHVEVGRIASLRRIHIACVAEMAVAQSKSAIVFLTVGQWFTGMFSGTFNVYFFFFFSLAKLFEGQCPHQRG